MNYRRLLFWFFYRLSTPPWEGHPLPQRLIDIAEGPSPRDPGKALDVGCGTGDTSIYLAKHQWQVTAFDFMNIALGRARAKAAAAGVSVRFFQADVTRVSPSEVGDGFSLIVDNGLLHGLEDEERGAYVRLVDAVAAPGATLLIAAFAAKERRGPRGIDRSEIERRFRGWQVVAEWEERAMSSRPNDPIFEYELRRRD